MKARQRNSMRRSVPRLCAGAAAIAVLTACAACSGSGGSSQGTADSGGTGSLVVGIPPVISGADVYVA